MPSTLEGRKIIYDFRRFRQYSGECYRTFQAGSASEKIWWVCEGWLCTTPEDTDRKFSPTQVNSPGVAISISISVVLGCWEPCFRLSASPRICPPLFSGVLNSGRWQEERPWGFRGPTLLQEGAGAHALTWGSPGGTHFRNSQAHSIIPTASREKTFLF